MGREDELEKQFSDDLDRLLAGKEVEAGAGAGEDYRRAIEFARKMVSLRALPSAAFNVRLKERLIRELEQKTAEKAAKEGRNWFWEGVKRLVPRQLVWQAVAATIALVIIIGGITWGTGLWRAPSPQLATIPSTAPAITPAPTTTAVAPATPAPSAAAPAAAPTMAARPRMPLAADGYTDKSSYTHGENVQIAVTLKNVTAEPFKIDPFPPIVSIMEGGSRQAVRTFLSGSETVTIPPNFTTVFTLVWDQREDSGQSAPDGVYYLELENINHRGQPVQVDFSQPVRWSIVTH